jgi:superfamily II DNA or RNA helicase
VIARGARAVLERTIEHADCTELHLAGPSEPSVLLSPFDRIQRIDAPARPIVVRLRRWAAHVREQDAVARVGGLHARPAGAAILPYQLAPALAVAAGDARVLLADEVGLGKTIQAGWILSHLLAENVDARVLIAVPAGLRLQWQTELLAQFGLASAIADAAWLRRAAADLPGDISPWSLAGIYITSLDFVKRSDVVRSIGCRPWDALVVDEAHAVRAPTERHAAIARLARRARRIVLITATPFSGDVKSFESIVSLGALGGGTPLRMFRRSKEDVANAPKRRHRFASIRLSRDERELQVQLARYTEEVWNAETEGREGAQLAMTVLRKRALSSPHAVLRSLRRRLELLDSRETPVGARQLALFSEDDDVDDGEPVAALAAPGLRDEARERRWLMRLLDAAARACALDSKHRFLERLVRRLRGESAIVFTEYRDSLTYLSTSLPHALLLHGGLVPAERWRVQEQFNARGGLLLATDAVSEGLNLQGRCRLIVNYELPWNPVRLEQRIGRVDRIGQRRPVHALTLVARHTAEEFVLEKLARRLYTIASTLGERDRLASLLDEARTAGIIIGRHQYAESDRHPILNGVVPDEGHTDGANEEAVRLQRRRVQADPAASRLYISTMRSGSGLAGGIVFIYRWLAATPDGGPLESQLLVLHAPDVIERPRSAGAARARALAALEQWQPSVSVYVSRFSDQCLAAVRTRHEAIVGSSVARERALMASLHEPCLFQAGLFDNRAVNEARQDSSALNEASAEHGEHIAALQRRARVQSQCDPIAILLVASS